MDFGVCSSGVGWAWDVEGQDSPVPNISVILIEPMGYPQIPWRW